MEEFAASREKREFFNELSAVWDEMGAARGRDEGVEEFVQASWMESARSILDVGCGAGVLAPHLLARYPQAEVIIELDFAERMLALNRQKHADSRLVRYCADARQLPFPDEALDLILCYNVAPHLGREAESFRELYRVLAPGGVLAIGHLLSSAELNRFHSSLHGRPVQGDHLPPAEAMARELEALGGNLLACEERSRWYFVAARKAGVLQEN